MIPFRLLVVEDDHRLADELAEYFKARGCRVICCDRPSKALVMVREHDFDAALIDIKLPEYDGLKLLEVLKKDFSHLQVVMMSGHGDMSTVIKALRLGAYDYLCKPFTPTEMEATLLRLDRYLRSFRENQQLRAALEEALDAAGGSELLGESEPMVQLRSRLDRAAEAGDTPVVILGESGTGKELAARRIHAHSPRSSGPFVAVNCAALSQTLVESELFGHVKGAFTGAASERKGHIRSAEGGTLFLDEIGELPLDLQAKFLRALESRSVRSVGSDHETPVDFRVICATNRSLRDMVQKGSFREDLYFRLSVLEITMPNIQQISEDIPVLARHFWKSLQLKMGRPERQLPKAFLEHLEQRTYCGNVRELRNLIERALILGHEEVMSSQPVAPVGDSIKSQPESLNLQEHEQRLIRIALERTGGNHSRAAELLGISRQALERRLPRR